LHFRAAATAERIARRWPWVRSVRTCDWRLPPDVASYGFGVHIAARFLVSDDLRAFARTIHVTVLEPRGHAARDALRFRLSKSVNMAIAKINGVRLFYEIRGLGDSFAPVVAKLAKAIARAEVFTFPGSGQCHASGRLR
jgi:hypothetical protein